jgi:hypothetical protein
MQELQKMVFAKGINPVDNNNTATDGIAFDTRTLNGTGSVACIVSIGNCAGTTSVFKIQHSEDGSTNWGDVTGGGFTALTASSDNTLYGAFIPCDGTYRRYFRVSITSSAAAMLVSAIWIGANNNQSPSSASERGLTEQLIIA